MSLKIDVITSPRHQAVLRLATDHLAAALVSLEQRVPLDFVSIDLDALGEATGETAREGPLDRIFS